MNSHPTPLIPFLAALVSVAAATLPACAQTLSGHLAYLKGGQLRVMNMATGRVQTVGGTSKVEEFSLAPQGGRLLLFQPLKSQTYPLARVMMALSPYRTLTPLPAPLNSVGINRVRWTRSGSQALLSGYSGSGQAQAFLITFRNARGVTVTSLPGGDEGTISGDGRYYAYAPNGDVRVRDLQTKHEITLLTWKKPAPLLAALKKSTYPKKMDDLLGAYDVELAKEQRNWVNGGLTFSRDGKTLFFTSNAGTSMGAAGNTTFAYFAGDVRTGKLLPLSKVGAQFGRSPHIAEVSPDGQRLMYGSSAHSSAIDNPVYIESVYLPTQASRSILFVPEHGPVDSNLEDGATWSPDSHQIAVSAYFYSTAALSKQFDANPNLDMAPPSKFTLTIRDASTGKILKSIPGAVRPSWGK